LGREDPVRKERNPKKTSIKKRESRGGPLERTSEVVIWQKGSPGSRGRKKKIARKKDVHKIGCIVGSVRKGETQPKSLSLMGWGGRMKNASSHQKKKNLSNQESEGKMVLVTGASEKGRKNWGKRGRFGEKKRGGGQGTLPAAPPPRVKRE